MIREKRNKEKLASYYQAVLPDKLFYANLLPYWKTVSSIRTSIPGWLSPGSAAGR